MNAVLYGVGVGPGDPELMTLKACRLIRENDIIAVPGKDPKETVAYKIAVQAVPELADKTLVPIYMPMVMNKDEQRKNHLAGARLLESWLDKGKNVVFLTLGDSTIYCTFSYLQEIVEANGYSTALVNGIPSFCAAAARLNTSLTIWQEPLHVIPATAAGSAVAGALSMAFGCTLMAPHGGIFVFPVVGNWPMYLVALAAGSVVTMALLGVLKKPLASK